ncbi:hypothetical protein HK405_005862, partial [Cladochytrium tenue]
APPPNPLSLPSSGASTAASAGIRIAVARYQFARASAPNGSARAVAALPQHPSTLAPKAAEEGADRPTALSPKTMQTVVDCKIDVFCHPLGVDGQDAGLSSLLSVPDIAAVVVALPILQQPAVIRTAIAAGRHVLSEKPVAGTVAAARYLLAWYDALPTDTRPFWGVAENYRFKRSLQFAAAKIAELGWSVNAFALRRFSFAEPDNKCFNTPYSI